MPPKKSPTQEAVSQFVRGTSLTTENWIALLEARRAMIRPFLDSITLQTLGSVRVLKSGPHDHSLDDDRGTLAQGILDSFRVNSILGTQGFFIHQPFDMFVRHPGSGWRPEDPTMLACEDGMFYIWGLDRGGEWLLVEVHFFGKPDHYEEAGDLIVSLPPLARILEITRDKPYRLWRKMRDVMQFAYERSVEREKKLRHLQIQLETEELMYEQIPKPGKAE